MKKAIGVFLIVFIISGIFLVEDQPQLEASAADSEHAEVASFQKVVDPNASYAALRNNLAAIGADLIIRGFGATGIGQVIGIVDTGVDPFMPGFARADGSLKIRNWTDITKEGKAIILGTYRSTGGFIYVNNVNLNVDSLKSKGGTYVVGLLPGIISQQLPSNPDVYFVAYDPTDAGVFRAVVVDTNLNLDFSDDAIIYDYNTSRSGTVIKVDERKSISLVVSSISSRGDEVIFGFDLHGHGTGMASIVSGYDREQGGVAPGADLVVAKAISSSGFGSWNNIIKGIEWCLNHGAGVVLVGAVSEEPVSKSLWDSVEQLAREKRAHIVMPAGNKGPGVGTLTVGSSWPGLVIASGYYPSATFNAIFNWSIERDMYYPYSSCGPDLEGNRGVDIMAPAIAPVPEPGYHQRLQFALMDGTSAAAAYTAGAVALLRQGAVRFGHDPLEAAVLSLLEGANPLAGLEPVEQGYGRINMLRAWSVVVRGAEDSRITLVRKWMGEAEDTDLWIRGHQLGALPLWIDNLSTKVRRVNLTTTQDWLKSQSVYLDVMPVDQRSTITYGLGELSPGFHSGEILADDPDTHGVDGRMVVNVAIPDEFSEEGKAGFPVTFEPGAGLERRFLEVPQSAQGLSLTLTALGGEARFMLHNPDGLLVEQGWIQEQAVCKVGMPKAGFWQLCLFRDPQDGNVDRKMAVVVSASLDGVAVTDLGASDGVQDFIVKSDELLGVTFSFIGSGSNSEWRDRRSQLIPTQQATFLPPLEITQDVEAICLRFGTGSSSSLKGYIYYLDETSGRWTELATSETDGAGLGQICLNEPLRGRYMACVEGYSWMGSSCYAEIDFLVVKGGTGTRVPVVGSLSILNPRANLLQVQAARSPDLPGVFVIRRGTTGDILAVVERAGAFQPALVQLSGTGDLRTIRAFFTDGLDPVDAYVTIGNAAYQLQGGMITVPRPSAEHGRFLIPGNRGMIRFGEGGTGST
ncbi:MAG: S8 family serine peptidase [Bacillota bacterium]